MVRVIGSSSQEGGRFRGHPEYDALSRPIGHAYHWPHGEQVEREIPELALAECQADPTLIIVRLDERVAPKAQPAKPVK